MANIQGGIKCIYHAIAKDINSFLKSHPDCHTIYGVATGCLWGDFGCVSVQAVECRGAFCN